jgi:hypothetical protein
MCADPTFHNLPGCGLVCKAYPGRCPPVTKNNCPPGFHPGAGTDLKDQCCPDGKTDDARTCCPMARAAALEPTGATCCPADQVAVGGHCQKSDPGLPLPPLCLPPGKPSILGKCCFPPEVPQGLGCGMPQTPQTPQTPQPQPAPQAPVMTDIFFQLDRPRAGEPASAIASALTPEGKSNFDALVKTMTADPTLVVQLVGRASPEGNDQYNVDLAARRARMVESASPVLSGRIATAPGGGPGCTQLDPGIFTCGKAGATGPRDREVQATPFKKALP